jgi:hypothetical protein
MQVLAHGSCTLPITIAPDDAAGLYVCIRAPASLVMGHHRVLAGTRQILSR